MGWSVKVSVQGGRFRFVSRQKQAANLSLLRFRGLYSNEGYFGQGETMMDSPSFLGNFCQISSVISGMNG